MLTAQQQETKMKDVCFEPKFDFNFPIVLTRLCCINIALTKGDNCMNECQLGRKI